MKYLVAAPRQLSACTRRSLIVLLGLGFAGCQSTGKGSGAEQVAASNTTNAEPTAAQLAGAPVVTAELMVTGVSCASCTVGIRRALTRLAGVEAVRAGDDGSHVLVDFRPATLTPEALVEAVNTAGYEAEVLIRAQEI